MKKKTQQESQDVSITLKIELNKTGCTTVVQIKLLHLNVHLYGQ